MKTEKCAICNKDLELFPSIQIKEKDIEYSVHEKCLKFYYGDILPSEPLTFNENTPKIIR